MTINYILPFRVYKNQNLAAYLQWYKDQKKTKAQLTNKPEKEGAGHLVTEIDMLGSMPSSRRGIYRRRGRSHRLALDTRAGRAKGQLQLWAIPSWQVCGLQTDFLFLWMGAIFVPFSLSRCFLVETRDNRRVLLFYYAGHITKYCPCLLMLQAAHSGCSL